MKKLDATPEKPHTAADVMKAMTALHKLVLKQAAAYGGKNSKYIPAHVLEGSLLQAIAQLDESKDDDCDEVGRLLDLAQQRAEDLAKHLEGSDDKRALSLLGQLLKYIGAAMSNIEKG